MLSQARAVGVRALLILVLILLARLLPVAAGAAVLIARTLLACAAAAGLAGIAVATGLRTARLGLRGGAGGLVARLAVVIKQKVVVPVTAPQAGAHPLLRCVGAATVAAGCGSVRAG